MGFAWRRIILGRAKEKKKMTRDAEKAAPGPPREDENASSALVASSMRLFFFFFEFRGAAKVWKLREDVNFLSLKIFFYV